MKTVINFKDVSFQYDDVPILQKISGAIDEGQFVAIFGPNGGGKTTFLKLLMGFLKPVSGEILVLGKSPQEVQTSLSYVPQAASFDRQFPISTLEVVMMGCLKLSVKEAKERSLQELNNVGLADFADAPFGSLSGGQAQRTLIARALASKPKILLLDEPTASVDPNAEKDILQILSRLKGSITIVMVTHDLNSIISAVDTLFCIQRTITPLSPAQVCEHFAMGLYHPPLGKRPS
jgi:zinc transport system ATP-binding protein